MVRIIDLLAEITLGAIVLLFIFGFWFSVFMVIREIVL